MDISNIEGLEVKSEIIDQPLISIITVVYNAEKTLEKTILSIINQTYKNIEYIIIDGGSTDKTLEIIKKYADKIDFWISEADSGLYFAMNKGLNKANGQWVNFMNSGDYFYSDTIIEELFNESPVLNGVDVIYGDVRFSFDGSNAVTVKPQSLDYFWKGMPFVHQTSFIKTSIMKLFPFDVSYKLIADYNSLYNIYINKYSFYYSNKIICYFMAGGLSDNNPASILECRRMILSTNNTYLVKAYYLKRYIECYIKYNFAKLIGQNNYALIRRIKNNS